ncbi:MAG: hypothetical protein K0R49_669 [Burkholderiales bacterium]|jgi:hypothetical protein|nr:hypothetical protein [Burkholderiales bacterium]
MRLQIMVDDVLGAELKTKAHDMGFSVSSYARFLLKNAITKPNKIDKALAEIDSGESETLTLGQFKQQIRKLKK